jgi:hypothetical protein
MLTTLAKKQTSESEFFVQEKFMLKEDCGEVENLAAADGPSVFLAV